jgi:hypothetical protein
MRNMRDTDTKCLLDHKCVNGACVINSAPTACISVSIKAGINNRYVCAENAGNSSLIANRDAVGPWETFDLIPVGDGSVGLKSYANGKYVTAENAGNSSLIANRDALGPWEKFSILDIGGGYVSFKAGINNRYVTAESAGVSPLIANRDLIGPWEKFSLSASSAGNCVASCVNECSPSGTRQCRGNGYWTCGYYDSDPCLDWSTVTGCLSGHTCLNGVCVAATSTTTTTTRVTTTSSTTTSTGASTTTTTRSTTTTTTIITCSSTPDSYLAAGDNSVVFQTPHPYYNGLDCYSGVYTCASGYSARIHAKYDVESWYDYFYVYNGVTGNAIPFTGNSSGYVWIDSGYNSVRFRFMSDESIARWGADVDLVECYAASTTTTSSTTTSSTMTIVSTTTTTLNTTSTSTTTQTTSSTTMSVPCAMKGNELPCDVVTLAEVVDSINQWVSGNLDLGQVIDLINSWADPITYPPR